MKSDSSDLDEFTNFEIHESEENIIKFPKIS
jgi:hypothetical protein